MVGCTDYSMPININSTACFRHERAVARMDRRELARARQHTSLDSIRAPFPCASICTECGALRDPVAADPHRHEQADRTPCVHCGQTAWADLTNDDTAFAVAEGEQFERGNDRPGRRVTYVVLRLAAAAALSVACVHALIAAKTYSILFTMLTSLFVLLFIPALVITAVRELTRRRRSLPHRWALALPPSTREAKAAAFSGPAVADGDLLRAPLSGRPCLAYEVRARRDGGTGSDRVALVDQRCMDLVVDGQAVPGTRTLLRVPATPFTGPASEGVQNYLRSRGVLHSHGPWILSETIIEPGQDVRVVPAKGGGAILMQSLEPRALPQAA